MRILLSQMNPIVGDLEGNARKILQAIDDARRQKADLVLFPELALCGYPPEDLLLLPHFIKAVEQRLQEIINATNGISVVVGVPRLSSDVSEKYLHNSAAIISNQKLLGYYDKMLLPTYDIFDEARYFEPGKEVKCWNLNGKKVGIIICEDQWQHSGLLKTTKYRRDPIAELALMSPDLVLNLSASPYSISKFLNRLRVSSKAAATLKCPLILCNQVGGNDSLIFDGYSIFIDGFGKTINFAKGFVEDNMLIDLSEKPQALCERNMMNDLHQALILGVRDYFRKSGFTKACLGLSGGIDSAVVACIATEALGKENVLGILMPSRYSSQGSIDDSLLLAKKIGIATKTISIEQAFESYLNLLSPFFDGKAHDVTEENLQSRIRGMILMAISNKLGYIVLCAANKSEMATGYSTLYGDMCGGLCVINDLTKSQVYAVADWINRYEEIIPVNVIKKPPSAELKHGQKDSDSLPDYSIIDTVVVEYVEGHSRPEEIAVKHQYPLEVVMEVVKKIHRSEYKRRQAPPGLRISEKSFTAGRRFPIVQRWVP